MSDQRTPPLPPSQAAAPQHLVVVPTKSVGLAVLLALFLGPLGLLYSSVKGGVIMFVVTLVIAIFTAGLGLIVCLPVCGVIAYLAAKGHNERLLSGRQAY